MYGGKIKADYLIQVPRQSVKGLFVVLSLLKIWISSGVQTEINT
jgi:hypothetical protein